MAARRAAARRETVGPTTELSRSCLAIMPHVDKGCEWRADEASVSSDATVGSPASHCGGAGLMVVVILRGFVGWIPRKPFIRNGLQQLWHGEPATTARLRMRRSQRRCNGPGGLRGAQSTGATMPTVETRARTMVHGRVAHGGVVPVVVSMVTVAGDFEAGKENGRDDEQDPGYDHNPRREPVQPIGFDDRCRRWRNGVSGDRGRPGWGFRCLTHTPNDARATDSGG